MRTLIVSPHPDDELLGCGGTLLRRRAEGGTVAWLLMTAISEKAGWSADRVSQRSAEVGAVRQGLGIAPGHLYELGIPPAELDALPMRELVGLIAKVFEDFGPEELLLPFPGDAHSDHRKTFEAASACTKWFRYPTLRSTLTYETPSETDFGIDPRYSGFRPNFFVNIEPFITEKLALVQVYKSEMGGFPFPRSERALRALAERRGAESGFEAAEAFMLLRCRF
jgi:LmbE family N-acetylglucosaminyl deacetylase